MRRLIALITVITMLAALIPAYAEDEEQVPAAEEEVIQTEEPEQPEPAAVVELVLTAEDNRTDRITLRWNDTGAEKYSIYRYIKDEYVLIDETEALEYEVNSLSPGKVYSFKVTDGVTSAKVKGVTLPAKVLSVAEKNISGCKAKVTFTCKGSYTGFQVRYSTKKSFSKYSTKTVTAKKAYLKSLKKNTKYYVKVRAYREYDGKKYYGSWSAVRSFTYHAVKKTSGRTYMDNVLIVNKTYSLPSSYRPGLKKEAANAFSKMRKAAKKQGLNIWNQSGYRSYAYQKRLYNSYLKYDSRASVDTYSARPGHSEHQSGLAMDLNTIKNSFANTAEGKWVNKNCWKYGFIIRYPKDSYSKTGYKYEPWHIRYVGKELARELYNHGDWITLEEHFNISSSYN